MIWLQTMVVITVATLISSASENPVQMSPELARQSDLLFLDLTLYLAQDDPANKEIPEGVEEDRFLKFCNTGAWHLRPLCPDLNKRHDMCKNATKLCDKGQWWSMYLKQTRRYCGQYCEDIGQPICNPCVKGQGQNSKPTQPSDHQTTKGTDRRAVRAEPASQDRNRLLSNYQFKYD